MPNLMFVQEVGLRLHGRSCTSSHPLRLSLPAPVSRRRSRSLACLGSPSSSSEYDQRVKKLMSNSKMMQRSLLPQIGRRDAL